MYWKYPFDRNNEIEIAVLPQKFDRSPEWWSYRIGDRIWYGFDWERIRTEKNRRQWRSDHIGDLTGRWESTVFKSEIGVRQGDNLSPLLFSIYLSDLESFLSSKYGGLAYISEVKENDDDLYEYIKMYIILYTDDTVILAESPTEL